MEVKTALSLTVLGGEEFVDAKRDSAVSDVAQEQKIAHIAP